MASALDPERHRAILADLSRICEIAGISPHYVMNSAKNVCSEDELDWLKRFKAYRQRYAGLVLTEPNKVDTRMMYMCGALVRNFIDARILPLNTVLKLAKHNELPDPTVLMIPNAYVARSRSTGGKPLWEMRALYDVLLERLAHNKPTVLFIQDMVGMAQVYGGVFADHIKSHYMIL